VLDELPNIYRQIYFALCLAKPLLNHVLTFVQRIFLIDIMKAFPSNQQRIQFMLKIIKQAL
jgi:hypothetical protein